VATEKRHSKIQTKLTNLIMIFKSSTFATVFVLLFCGQTIRAQITLHTEDLPRFYQAFDSVVTTTDSTRQVGFLNTLYVDKASKGLNEFIQLRNIKTNDWRKFILQEKKSLIEKRPLILSVLSQQPLIENKINRFKKLYPDFRGGDIYFLVGVNNTGGTINDKTVYIGAEVVASDRKNWAVSTVLHEFTHTQQWTQRNMVRLMSSDSLVKDYMSSHTQLLGRCLEEGLADFVSELVNGESLAKTIPSGHTAFGQKNKKEIWDAFKKNMFLKFDGNTGMGWLNSGKRKIKGYEQSDLGYFIGHQICKSYYNKSKNKQQALKEMMGINFTDDAARKFLIESGYLSQKDLAELE
jgi:hypothetical protein